MRTSILRGLLFGFLSLFLAAAAPFAQNQPATLITNARVIDGTGTPARAASVRIIGNKISDVGQLTRRPTDQVVDGAGLVLSPGFIDTHSHHDRGLFEQLDLKAAVSQGITTIVVGQDGGSDHPLQPFFDRLAATPASVNVASYVGHGTLRRRVMGADFKRAARPDEVAKMVDLLRTDMKAGALGLSSGLEYDPGIYSDPSELIALAKAVAPFGGRYISHVRSEDRTFWKAIEEAIHIGREARIPVQISHLKLAMRSLWGQTGRLIKMLDDARASGVQVTADIYPYTYWQAGMTVLFPSRDFENREAAEFALREVTSPEGLLIARFAANRSYEGKTLASIATLRGQDPPKVMMDMIRESEGDVGIVATGMSEQDVVTLTKWPFANICSDGMSTGGHPRGHGAFPRVLGRYVREQGALTLEEAIRKMTSLSAANVGLKDRGTIKTGNFADLVLFDAGEIVDRSTTADPKALSEGVHTVWTNGQIVFQKRETTSKRPGVVLRRASK